jgi:hypothetical protein
MDTQIERTTLTAHCSHCNSEDIGGRSDGCFWDTDKNEWVIGEQVDDISCDSCYQETSVTYRNAEGIRVDRDSFKPIPEGED